MTCNKNGIPNDPQKPMVTSGIRLGTAGVTTRGMKEPAMRQVGKFIANALNNRTDKAVLNKIRGEVLELAEQFDWELPDVILYPTGGGTGLIGM